MKLFTNQSELIDLPTGCTLGYILNKVGVQQNTDCLVPNNFSPESDLLLSHTISFSQNMPITSVLTDCILN